ncbi:polysaccharide pyruvyl transferase family protein [Candidatus Peregrinibacteria bacterium]|nr:polysaccharide pyruvyl transferase family protein [Candidatus Peregrinibacteria bacterium]
MKIVVCGNYGAQNLGDELILEGLLETLKTAAPRAEITVMSGDPAATTKIYNVQSVSKFPAGVRSFFSGSEETIKAVKECDYFILGGGGLFNDLKIHASIIWAIQARQALKYKKPLIIYGQSIGPLSTISKFLIKSIFKKAAFIAVRDQDSAKELSKIGVHQKIFVTPDLAFRLPSSKPVVTQKKSPTIIIALRNLFGFPNDLIKEFGTFCNWLIEEQNCQLEFIDFQQGVVGDYELHKTVIAHIQQKNKIKHFSAITDTKELLAHFEQADFVFGMRLHSIICAIKACKPFIAISYSRKIDSMIKDSGLEKYCLQHEKINNYLLQNLFISLKDSKIKFTEKLHHLNNENLKKHLKVEQKLKNFFS